MENYQAVVQKVVPNGKHGPFAVATSEKLDGSVTFSLEPTVWKEKDHPEQGSIVVLGNLRRKRAGWRAKLARYYIPSDEQPERSNEMTEITTENNGVQEHLNAIVNQFGGLKAADINNDRKAELTTLLQKAAASFRGYITHWDIEISSYESFFGEMGPVLTKWNEEQVFADREVLRLVALAVVALFLGKERVREFAFENLGTGRINRRPDAHHISWSETRAGNFMRSIGLFEDALDLYKHALNTAGYYHTGAAEHAREEMRKLIAVYRQSGQELGSLDTTTERLVSEIARDAADETRHLVRTLIKWTDSACYWDAGLAKARKSLAEMGYEEAEQHQNLQPAYHRAIEALLADREEIVEEQKREYGRTAEEVSWRASDLAKLYRLVSDEKNALTWELADLISDRLEIEEQISRYSAKDDQPSNERREARLEEVKARIAEVEAKLAA